ncbi:hypothetical protein J3A83DRAFT_4189030 [Scleroderma citrinum]
MKFFNGASQHLKQKFPVQHSGEKTANSCQTKWCSLRDNFYVVHNLKHASRFTWSDINGIGRDDLNKEWTDYMMKHKGAKCFGSQGFPLFDTLMDMLVKRWGFWLEETLESSSEDLDQSPQDSVLHIVKTEVLRLWAVNMSLCLSLTSVSWSKCKASVLSSSGSVEPVSESSHNTSGGCQGITITTANIHQDAIAVLKTYENDYSTDKLLYLGAQLMQS